MKRIVLTVILLILSAGIVYAEPNTECLDQCLSQSRGDENYCAEKCGRVDVPYAQQSLDIQRQALDIQRQQLEIQKQLLELQRQSQKQTSPDVQEGDPGNAVETK